MASSAPPPANAQLTESAAPPPASVAVTSSAFENDDGGGISNPVAPSSVASSDVSASKPMTNNAIIKPPISSSAPAIVAPSMTGASSSAVPATAATALPSLVSLSPDFTSSTSLSSSSNIDDQEEEKKEESAADDDDVVDLTMNEKPSASTSTSIKSVATANTNAAKPVIAATKSKSKKEESSPRRTGRKRTSTTMIIDGHVVKTANNYVVKGDEYVHGAYKADAVKPKKAKSAAPSKPSAPRQAAQYMLDRQKHNAIIKKRIHGEDNANRMSFMTHHCEALQPFLDKRVWAHLKENKKHAAPEPEKTEVLGSQPDCVGTTLRDYQMIGLDWMAHMHSRGMPFILGDEMGLGKTLQTIALIAHLKENVPDFSGPSLVICPLSVLYSWCDEIKKHAPSLKHFRFHCSDPVEREAQKMSMLKDILKYDIIITTYEMVKTPAVMGFARTTFFNLCVLDEGHVIKNQSSQISEYVRKIHSQCRVILTGTPLQNNLVELYAILNFLYPQYFTNSEPFAKAFNIGLNQIDPVMLLKANKLLKLFMIRRLKGEVEKLMPKKIETKILCPLSSTQVFWYKGFLMNEIESLVTLANEEKPESGATKHNMLRMLIMQLRKVCLHPYLFDFAEQSDINSTSVEELIATSGKLAVLDKILHSMFKNGNRTCIFSQFTSMLNILEDYCNLRGWRYCRFDGSTPRAQRNHIINRFNAPGSDVFIFLMSTRSGGLGLNLQTADTCILYDSDWNPQPDLQAMARVHRIGQKKTVHVYRLLSAGTVEERILERAEKKLYLDQMVNRGTSNRGKDDEGTKLSTEELLRTLKFGSNAVFSSSNDMPTDSDIAKVTDRSRSEDSSEGLLKGGAAKTANDFEKDKELTDTQLFCGVDFRKLKTEKEANKRKGPKNKFLDNLKQDWHVISTGESIEDMGKGKRNRKSRLLQVAGLGSGYGSALVPVLAMNNYELMKGEPSAWGRETKQVVVAKKCKKVNDFVHQDFCQICGDGGLMIECPSCPISVHSHCCGLSPKEFHSCTHHRCVLCDKGATGAGGLIYRCQSCPNAYCPDCLPQKPYRYLGITVPRFEKLGFEGNPMYFYIHCSKQCEEVAKAEFGFKVDNTKPKCPPVMDVSYAFGKDAIDMKEMAAMFKQKAVDEALAEFHGSPKKSPKKKSRAPKKHSPPRATGERISPRKRSPTPKASAAAVSGGFDLSSPQSSPKSQTGYI